MTMVGNHSSVLTVREAQTFLTTGEIRACVVSGRWQRAHRGVLVAHNGPLTPDEELWVCLLAAPPGSALAGPTAARLEGLRGFESTTTHVVVPHGQRGVRRERVTVLRSSRLGPEDVHPLRAPRRTCVERSVLDMASTARSPRVARAPLLAVVQQGLTIPDRLRDALARRGQCRHRSLITETIDDAEGGIQSLPEREFAQILRRCGLPQPTRQCVVRRPDGRYYLDADWEDYDLSAEVHGLPHLEVRNWDADLDRHNELTIDGRRLVQFASYAVRHSPDRVGDQVERGLRRGGFRR
ncbi:MAG: hypothetical protein GEU97_01035 [Actinophytocola sp.]|nr:hypothetical protein [Actinophytocola sp.]